MLFDSNAGTINIIDWGEVVVSHPFFSLNGCLWNTTHFNDINKVLITLLENEFDLKIPYQHIRKSKHSFTPTDKQVRLLDKLLVDELKFYKKTQEKIMATRI